jgi:hypothetical protein
MKISRTFSAPEHATSLPSTNTTESAKRVCQPGKLELKAPLSKRFHSVAAVREIHCQTPHKMADVKAILVGKYPAKAHARRVVEWMRKKNPSVSGVLYLEGQKTRMIEDNDETQPFRSCSSLTPLDPSLLTTTTSDNVDFSTTSPAVRYQTHISHTTSIMTNLHSSFHPLSPNQ